MKKIEKICNQIIEICENEKKSYKDNKDFLIKLYHEIEHNRKAILDEISLVKIIDTHRKLSLIKNRKASFIEEELIRMTLNKLPFLWSYLDEKKPDNIEILESKDQPRKALKLSFILMEYVKEILNQKDDKSKRYKKRIKEAIELLNSLNQIYIVPNVKEIFWERSEDKDEDVQYFALVGLENYFSFESSEKITKTEIKTIKRLSKESKDRSIASTCCQILINAGVIDELSAVLTMDDWKDNNW